MKKFVTLLMSISLLFGAAPVALAAEGTPSAQTSVTKDRATKLAEARAQRKAALEAAKKAYNTVLADIASTIASEIAKLDNQLKIDIADTPAKFPPKDAAARLKKLKKDHATSVRGLKEILMIERKGHQKDYSDKVKAINAAYKAAVKAAK
jgi:hypothetical protein